MKFHYKRYGDYINSFRAFPLSIDGLKPVERRVLLSTYLVARNKFTKCARVDGTCLGRFHPHGSSYGTIVQMVKQGFLEGQGIFGNNLGVEPTGSAAMRYTECMLKESTYNMMFKLLKYVPHAENYDGSEEEPIYLPTMFPVCLMGKDYTSGIGFGFRTIIPCYEVNDLKKRLMWLLGIRKTQPTIKPISDCEITAEKGELELLLTTGKTSIPVKGIIKFSNTTSKVIVKSWTSGKRFVSILNRVPIKKMLENGDIGWIDSSNKELGTEIVFTVLKQRNRAKIYKECLKQLRLATTGTVTFENTVTDLDENTKTISIDRMLLDTFQMFVNTNIKYLNDEIKKFYLNKSELKALEMIKPSLASVLKIDKITKESLPERLQYISEKSKVEIEVVKELFVKYRIQKLLTIDTDTSAIDERIGEFQKNLENIEDYVFSIYNELKL
jgi:DNA gyrase subunit A